METSPGRSAGCPGTGLRAEESSLTAPQTSAAGIVGTRSVLKACTGERSSRLRWNGERASGEAWDGEFDAGDALAIGATGDDAPAGVRAARRFHLPHRRRRDPSVRWGGRGEAVRPLPIPISGPTNQIGSGHK